MTSTLDDMCAWGAALGQGSLLTLRQARASTANRWRRARSTTRTDRGSACWTVGRTHREGLGFTVLVMNDPDSGATAVVAMNVSNKGQARADPLLPQDRACAERGPAGIAALVQGSRT